MSTPFGSFRQISWRISPLYFFYFSMFATFLPFIARFLAAQGLNGLEISIIVAVINGVNIFSPFLFSFLADRTGNRILYVRLGYFAIGVFYFFVLFGSGFWFYLSVFGLFGVFLSAVLPQMESLTLDFLGESSRRYGEIRLWGSIGFVLVLWLTGWLLDVYSVTVLPLLGTFFCLLMLLSTFLVPKNSSDLPVNSSAKDTEVQLLPEFEVPWFQVSLLLAVAVLWQFGMAPYNTFFDLYLKAQGFSAVLNGFLISFGTICEIFVFIYIARLLNRFSEQSLLIAALLLTILRWVLVYLFPESIVIILFSQVLHAATYGVVHPVIVHRIGRLFPTNRASFGQGLYVAIGTGVGLSVGNLLAGWLWDGTGTVFFAGAIWTTVALLITWFGFKEPSSSLPGKS